jgi:branched-chain amino acid transport system ATP-binding protein
MTTDILKAVDLTKAYGNIVVLKSVGITMRRGETHAVIGPNGAGKTTLFKVLSGEVPADQGRIEINGKRVEHLDGFKRVRMGVGRTFQVARVLNEVTVLENMIVAIEAKQRQTGKISCLSLRIHPSAHTLEEADAQLASMNLRDVQKVIAGSLAYGDRKRLELSMSLALQPELLMLDEPMAGMSPSDRLAAVQTIREVVRKHSISVLLTEHDMDVVFALADQVTVLNYGEVIASGPPETVRANSRVRDVYLGHGAQHA